MSSDKDYCPVCRHTYDGWKPTIWRHNLEIPWLDEHKNNEVCKKQQLISDLTEKGMLPMYGLHLDAVEITELFTSTSIPIEYGPRKRRAIRENGEPNIAYIPEWVYLLIICLQSGLKQTIEVEIFRDIKKVLVTECNNEAFKQELVGAWKLRNYKGISHYLKNRGYPYGRW